MYSSFMMPDLRLKIKTLVLKDYCQSGHACIHNSFLTVFSLSSAGYVYIYLFRGCIVLFDILIRHSSWYSVLTVTHGVKVNSLWNDPLHILLCKPNNQHQLHKHNSELNDGNMYKAYALYVIVYIHDQWPARVGFLAQSHPNKMMMHMWGRSIVNINR